MSALAMILTVAMLIPGDGAEKVSGEIVHSQPLDLRGEWKGTVSIYDGPCAKVQLGGGTLKVEDGRNPGELVAEAPVSFIDEGNGRFRLNLNGYLHLGIYRQERDRFIACYSAKHRPTEFKLAEKRGLMTLYRVKTNK